MQDMIGLFLVYTVFIGAMVSPGPDFFITIRNALGYSARAGVFTALGIAVALSAHMAYTVAGIGLVISQSVFLFTVIKWIGAGYLFYVGVMAFRSKGLDPEKVKAGAVTSDVSAAEKSDMKAFRDGVVTNLFNPKAMMFFIALFSQMVDPSLPRGWLIGFAAACMLTAFLWFSCVSLVMASGPVRRRYARISKWLDKVFGVFFMGVGVKLALSKMSAS